MLSLFSGDLLVALSTHDRPLSFPMALPFFIFNKNDLDLNKKYRLCRDLIEKEEFCDVSLIDFYFIAPGESGLSFYQIELTTNRSERFYLLGRRF